MPTTRCGGRTGTRTPRTSGSRCSDSRDRPVSIRADAHLARPPIQATGSLAGDHGRDRVDGAPSLWPGCACPRQHGRCGPAAGLLHQIVPQLAGAARVAEVMQRLPLDLADPLAAHVELLADLLKRAGAAVLQPDAQLEHSALTAGQRVEHGRHLLLEEPVRRGLGRGQRGAVLDEAVSYTHLTLPTNREV